MNSIIILSLCVMSCFCADVVDLPLLKSKDFTPSTLAASANVIIEQGENAANVVLSSASTKNDILDAYSVNERCIWLLRMTYVSKTDKPLRLPRGIGTTIDYTGVNAGEWPMLPVVAVNRMPFVISVGKAGTGIYETAVEYAKYCIEEGRVTESKFTVDVNKEQLTAALEAVRKSQNWKTLFVASDSTSKRGTMFNSEDRTVLLLNAQIGARDWATPSPPPPSK